MDPSTPHFEPCGEAPAIVVFTRDLRVHDNPALVAAGASGRPTVSLFVLDDRLLGGPRPPIRRLRFLGEALRDLDHSATFTANVYGHADPRRAREASEKVGALLWTR